MRKRKVPFSTLMENMTGYYKDCRGTAKGVKGTYYFCEKCNEEALSHFQNVAFLTTYKEYAPEIKSVAVFVGDKCF